MKKNILISFIALVALTIIYCLQKEFIFALALWSIYGTVLSVFIYFSFYKSTKDREDK
ncbi:hypothetical protein ACFW1J_25075 [Priestia aryabhattai]|uniref:hypothetical protein n=1 Tax=Priestia aryabhattai TaxID=412384 RepID=UPI000AE60B2D|nr:hypothetical protein [Priestia aryabhattai]MBU3571305.1 hypothetical protein [Priestia aryabhattai]MBX9968891.1 hypothetical protein [Priestia aryabhattai]MBY0030610.1 hypothetical protein [Priestia aryabhattai]MBZ6486456.1 hypothetical protein [Priestia aryabhattai]MDH3116485.1 hypothetical protein [Priestia aryabhattai]